MKTSTNALCARHLTAVGAIVDTAQSWRGIVRHDLWNIVDTAAIFEHPPSLLMIQNCHEGSMLEHRRKAHGTGRLPALLATGTRFALWEWRKSNKYPGDRKKVKGRPPAVWYYRVQESFLRDGRVEFNDPSDWALAQV